MAGRNVERGKTRRDVISVANMPDEMKIKDVAKYIAEVRSSFLGNAREKRGMKIEDVAKHCGVSVEEIKRVESGNVTEQDMLILSKIARLYNVNYANLLFLFRLAKFRDHDSSMKMAAYHDQKMDEETQKEVSEFIKKFKEAIE